MYKRKNFFLSTIAIIVTIFTSYAQAEINFHEPIHSSVIINKQILSVNNITQKKEVYLLNIKLTPQQKNLIWNYKPIMLRSKTRVPLPTKVYIGMNGVPVLDQGKHGTCVTFAVTAAIDALLGKGDYISQLCNLELGSYFSKRGADPHFPPSGWEGTSGNMVLNQMQSFGFINKSTQITKSCGGLTGYPLSNPDEIGKPMSLDEFNLMREDFFGEVDWDMLLTIEQRLGINAANPNPYDGNTILTQVKQFLALSDPKKKENTLGLVIFGSFLPYELCSTGACGRYHQIDDSWVVTNAMKDIDPEKDFSSLGGHEMVIIGYDDEAIAIDNDGVKHQGLLTLRNSWGNDTGDQGNYYMSYDYFEKFVFEIQLLYKPHFN